jgi:hypothetical protein
MEHRPRDKRVRALGLLSGGLDSALSARLLIDQGIEVVGLHLESPTSCRPDVRAVARELGISLEVRQKGEQYLRLMREPRWGYGRNMNPCVDCRVFMFGVAAGCLEELGADFVFTGEVVGQRPMSQARNTLHLIDREARLEGWILRPLSARLLPETEPERCGWVDRSRLLDISGRSRVQQLELATRLGLRHYDSPGGGCLLTDPIFSRKVADLFAHQPAERTTMEDVALLRLGRHFRIDATLKIVVGRSQEENRALAGFERPDRRLVVPDGFNGPSALVCGRRDADAMERATALIAHYTRTPDPAWRVRWREGDASITRPLGPAGRTEPPGHEAIAPVPAPLNRG